MKQKLIAALAAAALLCGSVPAFPVPFPAHAEEAAPQSGALSDTVQWACDGTTLSITGEGAIPDWLSNGAAWPWKALDYTEVVIGEGITRIGIGAFEKSPLTAVTIPDSVTEIGHHAFAESRIQRVTIPAGVRRIEESVFRYSSLAEVHLPDGLEAIGQGAFYDCQLTAVTIPDSVTELGAGAFQECRYLAEAELPAGLTAIPESLFSGCALTHITIPESVRSIGDRAFFNNPTHPNQTLTEVVCTQQLDELGTDVFSGTDYFVYFREQHEPAILGGFLLYAGGCTGSVTVPEGVKVICENAFNGNTAVTAVTLPEGVQTIRRCAFAGCTSLTEASLPDSVKSIGEKAFSGCTSLTEVRFPAALEQMGREVFAETPWLAVRQACDYEDAPVGNSPPMKLGGLVYVNGTVIDGTKYGAAGGRLDLPAETTCIAEGAFQGSSMLRVITIPEGVREIPDYAFCQCESLTRITILNPACTIGDPVIPGTGIGVNVPDGRTICNTVMVDERDEYAGVYRKYLSLYSGVIRGYDMSPAQVFAEKYGYRFESLGEPPDTPLYHAGMCGEDVRWLLDDKGTLTITGKGAMTDYRLEVSPWYNYRERIQRVVVGEGVTALGVSAFRDCTALTEAELPAGLTGIGDNAFSGCTALQSLTLPDNLRRIGSGAFSGSGLVEITFPRGITEIAESTLSSCRALARVTISNPQCAVADPVIPGTGYPGEPDGRTICNICVNEDTVFDGWDHYRVSYSGVICCYDGSPAEAFAKRYGYAFESLGTAPALAAGDVNGDGFVNASDAAQVLIAAAAVGAGGESPLNAAQQEAADYNHDGSINASDAAQMLIAAAAAGAGGEPPQAAIAPRSG